VATSIDPSAADTTAGTAIVAAGVVARDPLPAMVLMRLPLTTLF
jgi:hypothetical protein